MEMGVGGGEVKSYLLIHPQYSWCNFGGTIWETTVLGIPPALKHTFPWVNVMRQPETDEPHDLFFLDWWPLSPHNMAEAPRPLDTNSLLHLAAVALAAGAHPSWVDLLYPFICFSAALNNIFIIPILEHLFHIWVFSLNSSFGNI